MPREFSYEIVKKFGSFGESDDYRKEVNLIAYNGASPKIDIRIWRGEKMLKGIAISKSEAKELLEILSGVNLDD